MVDIHSHILWGVDDGAKTLEESVAMAHLAADSGTTDIVATPHKNDHYPYDPQLIQERLTELRAALDGSPRIHLGADFHLNFVNVEAAFEDPRPFTINRLRYLMVELPDTVIPPNLLQTFEHMLEQGIFPVITHPERNRALWRDPRQFENWLEAGCYSQITAQSLDGFFGKSAKEKAWELVDKNQAHFVASDGHDLEHRPPRLDLAFQAVAAACGEEFASFLFRENPRRAIEGAALSAAPQKRKSRNRFRLFR